MTVTRREFLAASTAGLAAAGTAAEPPRPGLGVVLYSYGIRSGSEKGVCDPVAFAAFCRKRRVEVAGEDHKDHRVDELAALMRRLESESIGVCLDTGNNIALLDDPLITARELARWTLTVHLKDMGVEESPDGFLLAEVPLGQGLVDLKGITAAVRAANPKARFNLEMITRDPVSIPCLGDKYW